MKNAYYSNLWVEGFEEQISEIYEFHEKQLVDIAAGELLPKLEVDPLTGEKRDYSTDEMRELMSQPIEK